MVFEDVYEKSREIIREGKVIGIIGTLSIKDEFDPVILAQSIQEVEINIIK